MKHMQAGYSYIDPPALAASHQRTESLTNASASLLRLVAENDGEFLQFFGGEVFHSGF